MDKRQKRNERSDQGLCIDCGVNPKVDPQTKSGRCQECRNINSRYQKDLYYRDIEKHQQIRHDRNRKKRDKVFDYYGRKCVCCGETIDTFLCIDHINGGGNQHRKQLNLGSGGSFYDWLIKEGFPGGFQTLCYNCNNGKKLLGHCP